MARAPSGSVENTGPGPLGPFRSALPRCSAPAAQKTPSALSRACRQWRERRPQERGGLTSTHGSQTCAVLSQPAAQGCTPASPAQEPWEGEERRDAGRPAPGKCTAHSQPQSFQDGLNKRCRDRGAWLRRALSIVRWT